MVEIIIVVGILVLLVGMILPVARGVIDNQKGETTRRYLELLADAIDEFKRDSPLSRKLPPDDFDPSSSWAPLNTEIAGFLKVYITDTENNIIAGLLPLDEGDHRSIEAVHLYLTMFSDKAAKAISDLPKANRDVYANGLCRDVLLRIITPAGSAQPIEERIPLLEFVDAWKRPLRYETTIGAGARVRWELRSAGPDGNFALAFSPESASDDIVVAGE